MSEPLRSIVVNEVPLWDAKVQAILVELREVLLDRSEDPVVTIRSIHNLHEQLDLMLRKLEDGKWPEGILAPAVSELEGPDEP